MSTLEKINMLLEKAPQETLDKVYRSILIIINKDAENARSAPPDGVSSDERAELLKELDAIRARNRELYPEELCARYKMEAEEMGDMPLDTMETIAAKRGFLLPGKRIDYERTAVTVLDEFRSGKIGCITLELPPAGK